MLPLHITDTYLGRAEGTTRGLYWLRHVGSLGEELVAGTPGSRTSNKMVTPPSFPSPDIPLLLGSDKRLLSLPEAEKGATGRHESALPSSVSQQAATSHLAAGGEAEAQGRTSGLRPHGPSVRPHPGPLTLTVVGRASLTSSSFCMHSFASGRLLGTGTQPGQNQHGGTPLRAAPSNHLMRTPGAAGAAGVIAPGSWLLPTPVPLPQQSLFWGNPDEDTPHKPVAGRPRQQASAIGVGRSHCPKEGGMGSETAKTDGSPCMKRGQSRARWAEGSPCRLQAGAPARRVQAGVVLKG